MKIFEHVTHVNSRVKSKFLVSMMILSFSALTIFNSQLANAAVYKKVDADGNVSFSDLPDKTAKLITVAPLSTVPAMSPDLIASTLKDDQNSSSDQRAVNYALTIISPEPNQTYQRGSDAFSANVQVSPDLKNGDHLLTLVDGKPAGAASIEEMDRGQHQFEAKVVNARGRVLTSQAVSFFVQQSNVKQQARMGIKR